MAWILLTLLVVLAAPVSTSAVQSTQGVPGSGTEESKIIRMMACCTDATENGCDTPNALNLPLCTDADWSKPVDARGYDNFTFTLARSVEGDDGDTTQFDVYACEDQILGVGGTLASDPALNTNCDNITTVYNSGVLTTGDLDGAPVMDNAFRVVGLSTGYLIAKVSTVGTGFDGSLLSVRMTNGGD